MMDDLLLLVILGSYFLMLCVLAFIAGQLLILVVEYAADWLERRQDRAGKQVKAVSYRSGLERERTFRIERCERRYH